MHVGAVARAVVAHHPLDRHAHRGKPPNRSPQEAGGRLAALVCEHLHVGQAGRVIDADVDELPAGDAVATGVGEAIAAVAGDAMSRAQDPPQLLDVDVDQLSGARSLVAVWWLGWLEAAALAQPDPRQPPRDGR